MDKFQTGDRVLFTDVLNQKLPSSKHMASMREHYIHLNATDESGRVKPISGTIVRVSDRDIANKITYYIFRPCNWDSPSFSGFEVDGRRLKKYNGPDLPGPITNGQGQPIE